jgi:hypothetical protein
MSSSTIALAEGLLVVALVLGFGVWQLWDLRRDKRK